MLFEWSEKKNEEVQKKRGVSFEFLSVLIIQDSVVIPAPNESRKQSAFLVVVDDYPFVVPFEVRKDKYRLITAWPDRRYKK